MVSEAQATPKLIGEARHARLLAESGGDLRLAHELFVWSVRASRATLEALQVFELLLRNAIDHQLRIWNEDLTGQVDWLLRPHRHLDKVLSPAQVSKATARARRVAHESGRELTHDDILAQMSFGTWRYILPSKSGRAKRKLWEVATSKAFPHWPGDWDWRNIVSRVTTAHEVRNRVAHLEPLHAIDLRKARRDMRSVSHAIGVDAGRLFTQTERMLPIIESNPLRLR